MISDNNTNNSIEKVDFQEIIKKFKVNNMDTFSSYLKEVWLVRY